MLDSPSHRPFHQHSVDRIVQLEGEVAKLIAASKQSKALLNELHDQAALREERLELARYQAFEEAERAELLANELESIFQQVPLALLVVATGGAVIRANAAAEMLLSWRMDTMLAGSIEILRVEGHVPTNVAAITPAVGEALDTPSAFAALAAEQDNRRVVLLGSDGLKREVSLSSAEVMTAQGFGYLLVLEALPDAQTVSV